MLALGEGRRDALVAIPGGLLGAAAWTLLYQTPLGHWLIATADFGDLVVTGDIHTVRPVPILISLFTRLRIARSAGCQY
jgi:hypothetical protein